MKLFWLSFNKFAHGTCDVWLYDAGQGFGTRCALFSQEAKMLSITYSIRSIVQINNQGLSDALEVEVDPGHQV